VVNNRQRLVTEGSDYSAEPEMRWAEGQGEIAMRLRERDSMPRDIAAAASRCATGSADRRRLVELGLKAKAK
jgi:hypothetical protein